jgi:hypothetical protein
MRRFKNTKSGKSLTFYPNGAGNPCCRGRLSTVDLLVLTSLDQLLFYWKYLTFFQKTSYPNQEVNGTEPSPSVSIPWIDVLKMYARKEKETRLAFGNFFTNVPGKSYWRRRLNTVDLLSTVGCLKKEKYGFSVRSSWFKLVSSRRSTVLILPL